MCLYVGVGAADETDDGFRALASLTRRRLLRLVRDGERSVGELATGLGISQPAVSQHLVVLRDAGLVVVRPDGRRRLVRADHTGLAAVGRFFDDYWSDALDRLADAAEATASERRAAG